ncbi:MAG: hypothetical protein P8Y07_15125 [Gemmatimonadales bacterium]
MSRSIPASSSAFAFANAACPLAGPSRTGQQEVEAGVPDGVHACQVEDESGGAEAHEVAVPLDEAGDGEVAVEVDNLRVPTDERLDLPITADGQDPPGRRRQRGRLRPSLVQRDDSAISEDEVRRACLPFSQTLGLADAEAGEHHQRQGKGHRGTAKCDGPALMSVHCPVFPRSRSGGVSLTVNGSHLR